jgi:hypothetical protein
MMDRTITLTARTLACLVVAAAILAAAVAVAITSTVRPESATAGTAAQAAQSQRAVIGQLRRLNASMGVLRREAGESTDHLNEIRSELRTGHLLSICRNTSDLVGITSARAMSGELCFTTD